MDLLTPKAHALDALNGSNPLVHIGELPAEHEGAIPLLLPRWRRRIPASPAMDAVARSSVGAFLLAFVVVVYETEAGRRRPLVLAAVLVMLVAAPSIASQLAGAEADVPMAALRRGGVLRVQVA